MPRVLIGSAVLCDENGSHLRILREAGLAVVFPPEIRLLTESDLLRCLPGVHATIAGPEPYTARVIESAKDLCVIARSGVGYDSVDVEAATRHGVAVTITPGTNHDAVAEHAFALLLALAKDVVRQHQWTVQGGWSRQPTVPVRGQTLGIVGLGRIGKAMALRGLAFGMKVLATEKAPDWDFIRQHGIELVSLEELLRRSDFVSLHAPYTPETRYLIRAETIRLMKPTAFLINTARGGLVCERDLLEALEKGQIRGAGLDVFEKEPPGDNPLFRLPNVIVSPHLAGADTQSLRDMAEMAARTVVGLLRGEWFEDGRIVNPEVRPRLRRPA
ncbi:MAG: phosphoglycerate dehydrogenase [Gemmatales bacterium]|nr:phosphoglycerate dehydrogenase [Gemmatales bacterium]